jgi:hypothetical protein
VPEPIRFERKTGIRTNNVVEQVMPRPQGIRVSAAKPSLVFGTVPQASPCAVRFTVLTCHYSAPSLGRALRACCRPLCCLSARVPVPVPWCVCAPSVPPPLCRGRGADPAAPAVQGGRVCAGTARDQRRCAGCRASCARRWHQDRSSAASEAVARCAATPCVHKRPMQHSHCTAAFRARRRPRAARCVLPTASLSVCLPLRPSHDAWMSAPQVTTASPRHQCDAT